MIPNPIRRVLSSIEQRQVRALLMGGQACVLYGAAEFSRDTDLVQAKKTQRDKDWPMVRRLVEAHYFQNREKATAAQVRFWLRDLRTPELLVEAASRWHDAWSALTAHRRLLVDARPGRELRLSEALLREERAERQRDARYWGPLKAELERLRHERPPGTPSAGREGR